MTRIPLCPVCQTKMKRSQEERFFGEPWSCPKCGWTGTKSEIKDYGTISARCPHCHDFVRVPKQFEVTCPNCNKAFYLPKRKGKP